MQTITTDRKLRALEATFFPVEKRRGQDGVELINTNTGARLSGVSERYELVSNRELVRPFVEKYGAESLAHLQVFNGGRSFLYKFETGRQFEIASGDLVKEQLVVQNSYDKTKSFSFMFGAFRFVCANGLYYGQAEATFKQKHLGAIPVQQLLESTLKSAGDNDFGTWARLAKTPLALPEQLETLSKFSAYEVDETLPKYTGNAQTNLRVNRVAAYLLNQTESVDNSRTAWGLYNQINRAIAQVTEKSAVSKRILGNKNAEAFIIDTVKLN